MGINSISIGDFNFDGNPDFSLFEQSYAGPNTTSLYFLYDPKTHKYFNSGWEGVSLDFDFVAKKVFERNSCCAGRTQTTATYKVVQNKLILIEEHCYTWDEKTEELVERKMDECK